MDKKHSEKKLQPVEHIDYKDIVRLRAYMNPHARILGNARTGLTSREQRDLARAVKRARFMALVPYVAQ
jgi:small subunit ribosomal protein S18